MARQSSYLLEIPVRENTQSFMFHCKVSVLAVCEILVKGLMGNVVQHQTGRPVLLSMIRVAPTFDSKLIKNESCCIWYILLPQ
uniref:Uncharacterized protein n=1 Tax=Anguilla anguilla TaxID=7936 RepID=A0A0E9X233_ANGAN